MRRRSLSVTCALVAAAIAGPALGEGSCETRGVNGMVAVVLCPPGQSMEQWREAGVAACGERKPCGAWIWDDANALPTVIPDKHDDLSPEAIRAAKAIWVNEKGQLLVLGKTN